MSKITFACLAFLIFLGSSIYAQTDYQYLLFEATNTQETVDDKFPLIVFLHGSGERGSDLSLVEVHGPPMMVKSQKNFPFYVLSPQCPKGKYWTEKKVNKLVGAILGNYPIDPNRVYLTGLSMGGFGTWLAAMESPELYAAIAPICGGTEKQGKRMKKIKDIPMWVFHGAKDEVVPVRGSEQLVAMAKAEGANVRFTVYDNAGHDSWTKTYSNPELYGWFLRCVKK